MREDLSKTLCLVVPDLQKGGMEKVMSELANFFCTKADTEVNIIILINQSSIFYKISSRIKIHKPQFTFKNNLRVLSSTRTLFFLRRTIKKINPDAVLSFGEKYNSFVLLSCLFLNLKVFVSDRSRPDKKWGFFHTTLRKILYPKASGIISQTNYSRDFLLKETSQRNIMVIPNPVREINIKSAERRNIILNVGRLIKTKRIDMLLKIFSDCENDEWELWLVGDDEGNEKNILTKLSIEMNITDKVTFWGKQKDIDKFYRKAKIFAFTSESEGLPNVLLEAMAAGLACISFDCIAGPSDLIKNGTDGFIVNLFDTKMYISKLNLLIKDAELRDKLARNAILKSKQYNINNIGEKFYKFLLK